MTAMTHQTVIRQPRPSSLADVLDLILDKGMVIDAYIRISLVGIELITIDARIVIASVDTYLRFASMTNRLDLKASDSSEGLPQLMHDMMQGGASDKTRGALSGAAEQVSSWFGGDDGDEEHSDGDRSRRDGEKRQRRPPRSQASKSSRSPRVGSSKSRDGQRRRGRSNDEEP